MQYYPKHTHLAHFLKLRVEVLIDCCYSTHISSLSFVLISCHVSPAILCHLLCKVSRTIILCLDSGDICYRMKTVLTITRIALNLQIFIAQNIAIQYSQSVLKKRYLTVFLPLCYFFFNFFFQFFFFFK